MSSEEFSDYIVYVDESGDPNLDKINENFPVFVLTLCIVNKDVYVHKIIPEMSIFKFKHFGHDMIVLHERDIRKQTGEFKGLKHQDQFLAELTQIIKKSDITLIGIVIKKQSLTKKYAYPKEPYSLAMQFGLERLWDFIYTKKQTDRTTFVVCESRGKKRRSSSRVGF